MTDCETCKGIRTDAQTQFRNLLVIAGESNNEAAEKRQTVLRSLEKYGGAERDDWRRVPMDHLFKRPDAIIFMNSAGRKFYSPAILRAVLLEGPCDRLMYDSFMFDLSGFIHAAKEDDIPFARLYDAAQRSSFARFCKFAAFNARRELGRELPLRILERVRKLGQ